MDFTKLLEQQQQQQPACCNHLREEFVGGFLGIFPFQILELFRQQLCHGLRIRCISVPGSRLEAAALATVASQLRSLRCI